VNRLVRERQGGEPLEPYDVIYLDAFNDYSVPYQLTTLEQNRMIRELLAPSGAYMINMIDSFDIGLLLGSIVGTLREAVPNVHVFYEGTAATLRSRATFVVFASTKRFDFDDVTTASPDVPGVHALTDAEVAAVTSRRARMILTDDWAPTENLLAPVVESSSARLASGALVSRGIQELNRGRLASAEQKFTRALEIDPREHQANRYLGAIRAQLGDYEGARSHYETSLRFDPTQVELYEDLALEASNRGRWAEAEAFVRRGLDVEPLDEDLQVNLGILLAQKGDLPGAVSQFERVVRTAPESFAAHVSLGRALAQLGDPERALEHLELAARLRPDDDALRELIARTRKLGTQSPNR
jgi:Flp pilus assembly protein TadD